MNRSLCLFVVRLSQGERGLPGSSGFPGIDGSPVSALSSLWTWDLRIVYIILSRYVI